MIQSVFRICLALGFFQAISIYAEAQAILRGTVAYLNSGSRPAVGVDISAFGANTCATKDAGMFELKFSDKKPGDKVKIIVGSKDSDGTALELVNDKVVEQVRIPSKPDDDIVEIIVCKVGQRNDAALRYNGIIVKTINETTEKRLRAIDEKLSAAKIDAETIVALQNEKAKLAAERDSALAKAEEQALYIASINLDKASQLVRDAVMKVDSLQDIPGAIAVLDNEILLEAYDEANKKLQRAKAEINQVIEGFKLKIVLLPSIKNSNSEVNACCRELERIYKEHNMNVLEISNCFDWATLYTPELFMARYKEAALDVEQKTGISAYAILAQAAVKSRWGKDVKDNNLFGYKDSEGLARKFDSPEECLMFHAGTYVKNERYASAVKVGHDPVRFIQEISMVGYARPDDSQILIRVIELLQDIAK